MASLLSRLRRLALSAAFATLPAWAADHLDTPTVTADPAADIGDFYAWTSADGRRLNLVMTIVGKRFSDQVQYVFHVDSGKRHGETTASMAVVCQFDTAGAVRCWAGQQGRQDLQADRPGAHRSAPATRHLSASLVDHVQGDASAAQGLESQRKHMRVFAGPRDDPYFNNVRGTRAAFDAANDAVRAGNAAKDASGYRVFDAATLKRISALWQQTQGGPARNFLLGWKTSALVISVDLELVNTGGPLLAAWARTERRQPAGSGAEPPSAGAPIDRMGRALTANALLGLMGEPDIAEQLREAYNRAERDAWPRFEPEMARNLALYDSLDGVPGNQWLADTKDDSPARYRRLAAVMADDRLWVDSRQTRCEHYLAVERSAFGPPLADCGGRTPLHNVNAVFRSLLIRGTPDVVDDGVDHDDQTHSTVDFPFLAAP